MNSKSPLLSLVLTVSVCTSIASAEEVSVESTPDQPTIAHQILDLEAEASEVTDKHYETLESILSDAELLFANNEMLAKTTSQNEAIRSLASIGQLLARRGFRLRLGVKSFAEMLTPRSDRYGRIYYEYDCDTSSLLYVSIGQRLGLPISFVESKIPGSTVNHNFVRWDFGNSTGIDWDTNGRFVRRPAVVGKFYGRSFSPKRLLAYAYFMRGKTWDEQGSPLKSIEDYRRASEIDPGHPRPANNLAWMYVSNREVQEVMEFSEALEYAQRSLETDRDPNILDTLACTIAEGGDFSQAITLEYEALRMTNSREYANRLSGFRRQMTYLQQQGR
ncbi:Tetratricopeptide repeat protein [Thalassoglobus neptunius]|uniref:Tetratricopeptide repeat protein n=1 Tax=Thalassoglobus neptunius TaxID=1938619 RepID=A0A5C5W980_9PLAN|nr:hypothetical protein [Thalassoglobus neptunius]TWT47047.1 Tetratricopeptide repeat protein [Thalassoglobus neptunius]